MKIVKFSVFSGLLIALLLGVTGGGGGGGGTTPAAPTRATLKLSINNLPVGIKAATLSVNFILPTGVVPIPLAGNDASGAIAFSGNNINVQNSLSAASYIAATGVVTIGAVSLNGLVGGEYMTLNCAINPGTTVSGSSFPATATFVSASDTSSVAIVGLTIPIAVTLQ
ncbi:MAG: hypothetical protein HY888_14485 [Deltaproteobacteria bacterium]|nr:hypothetical protein [Deltaproteobacteria bacterium]